MKTAIREQSVRLITKALLSSYYLVALILIALACYIVWGEIQCRNAGERALRENEGCLEERVKFMR